ncbi:hypothetical protein [Glaciihabitans sp. dw_435]|uniref:hypothetical protein n=1 Tax=Glaciihabitans sp. dw_435 TaxID=2720081 RepID=UPI001BD6B428|nr:hypothetical protein [Glaciihabitans sp. dw_435]
MAHSYQLHVDLDAQCLCCRSQQPFHFTSATDQVVCAHCVHHLGSDKAERRDSDHVALWLDLFTEAQQDAAALAADASETIGTRDATIADLTEQVAQLAAVVAGQYEQAAADSAAVTPAGAGVRALLESDAVKRAERNTVLATRRIDWAMAALWAMSELHRDDPAKPMYCVCGKSLSACAEGKALEPVRQSILDWEKKNVALLQEGKRHGLPDDHPAVVLASGGRAPGRWR